MVDLSIPQRQAPIAVVFLAMRTVRQIGVAQLAIAFVFLVTGPLATVLAPILLAALAALAAYSITAWWRFTFQLVDGELVVHRGVLRSDRLTVPVDRVQGIVIEQELLHRLVDVVKVGVDSAGSSATELELAAVSRAVAEQLEREAVTTVGSRPADDGGLPPPVVERIVIQHRPRRLVTSALTSSPLAGIVVLAPVIALIGVVEDVTSERIGRIDAGEPRWWWLPVTVVVLVLGGMLLNLVRVVFQDWDLTVRATPTGVRRTAGLLSRTSTATSVDRVQVLAVRRNPVERRVGLADLRLATIGDADIVVDGADDAQCDELRSLARLSRADRIPLDRRIHPASIWLAVRNSAIGATAAVVGLWFLVGPWSLVASTFVVSAGITEARRVATFRWSITDELATWVRVVNTTTQQALLFKANGVSVTQSLYERRRGLAQLRLATAAGAVTVGMIPLDEATAARDRILHTVETDHRAWM